MPDTKWEDCLSSKREGTTSYLCLGFLSQDLGHLQYPVMVENLISFQIYCHCQKIVYLNKVLMEKYKWALLSSCWKVNAHDGAQVSQEFVTFNCFKA